MVIATRTACLIVFLAGAANAQTAQGPLNVEIIAVDAAHKNLSVAVTNTSGQAITAYAIELTVSQGQKTPVRIPRQIDGFSVADQRPLLTPNQTATLDFPLLQGASAADVSVTATAVVLENVTVVGAPALGARILNRRAERRDDMWYWLRLVKDLMIKNSDNPSLRGMTARAVEEIRADALMADVGRAAMRRALADLEPIAAEHATRSQAANGLQQNLRRLVAMSPEDREASIATLLDQMEREYVNAVKHAGGVR